MTQKVADLRKKLVESFGWTDDEANAVKGKAALIEALEKEMNMGKDPQNEKEEELNELLDEIFEDSEVQEEVDAVDTKTVPIENDHEWTEYFIEQMQEDEVVNGKPRVVGLRRVACEIFGDILSSKSDIVRVEKDWCAITHEVVIERYRDQQHIIANGSVDVHIDRLPFPFNKHLVSSADTVAEGKALRRACKLNIMTHEETEHTKDEADVAVVNGSQITSEQILVISTMCRRSDINLEALVKSVSQPLEVAFIEDLSYTASQTVIKTLNTYRNPDKVPAEFKGYDESWKVRFKKN